MNPDTPTTLAALISVATITFLFFRCEKHRRRADYYEHISVVVTSAYLRTVLREKYPDGLPKDGVTVVVDKDGEANTTEP